MFTFIYDIDIVYIAGVGADFKMDVNMWKRYKKELQKLMCLHYPQKYQEVSGSPSLLSILILPQVWLIWWWQGRGQEIKTRHFQIKKIAQISILWVINYQGSDGILHLTMS